MRTKSIFLATSAIIAPAAIIAVPAAAQSITLDAPEIRLPLDENGVNLATGQIATPSSTLAIGGADGLVHSRTRVPNGWRHNFLISAKIQQGLSTASVSIGGVRRTFTLSGGVYVSDQGDGSKISANFSTGTHTFTARDGTQIIFKESYVANGESYYEAVDALAEEIIRPNGHTTTLHYRGDSYQEESMPGVFTTVYTVRLQSVTTNTGYQLKFAYVTDTPTVTSVDDWYEFSEVTALNNAVEYCDPTADSCTFSNSWPSLAYATSTSGSDTLETITDALGRQTRFRTDSSDRLTGIKRPSETTDGVVIAYDANSRVSSVTHQGSYVRNYSFWIGGGGNLRATLSDSLGRTLSTRADPDQGVLTYTQNAFFEKNFFAYDSSGRLERHTAPEGNQTVYTYDARGNTTEARRTPKTGSSDPAIVTTWSFPASCTNNVTCNKPTQMTDPRGKVYTYTWDGTHGGLLSLKAPTDSAGHAAETRYTYANLYAKAKNSSGTLVDFSDPITKLWKANVCRHENASTCAGTANERITELYYNNNIEPNLHAVNINVRQATGSPSYTTNFTYTDLGLIETVDGPQTGAADTSTLRYDVVGQVIGRISPDPDGAGGNPHLATRYTYNDDGQVTITEGGTVTGTSDTDFANISINTKAVTTYDDFGRVETAARVAPTGTTQYSLIQYSYDTAGRLECTALRMNAPNTGVTLPSDACTQMTAGTFGEDRITRRYYDAADRVTEVWSGVGTSKVQQSAEMSYNENGTVAWVEDAKDNRTGYTYDGHDRSIRISYPSETTPNTVDISNYEQVTYDLAGNITSHRTRRGETISYTYDDLNRVTLKTVPNRTGLSTTHTRDVRYSYDLYGNIVSAWFDGTPDDRVTLYFNALGQLNRESRLADGVTRDVSYQYDTAGRLSRMTHPDNAYWRYSYDNMGRFDLLRDNGTAGLVDPSYNADGTMANVARLNSAPDNQYFYDTAQRLDRIFTDHANASQDVNRTWTYNPASQAQSETVDNQSHVLNLGITSPIDNPYVPDGLNQYDSVDSVLYGHDANGNLSSDGTNTFIYDIENRLVSVTGGNTATLRYDPLGRLHEVEDGSSNKRRMLYSGNALIAEYNAGGTMLDRYVHGLSAGDDPLIHYPGSGTTTGNAQFLYGDMRGSIVASFKADGSQVSLTPYDEYGVHGSASPGRFGYTGQAWVPEAGLYYYKARIYSPSLGRFMQTDPIGYADGLNMYRYVGNDPVNGIDPTGFECVTIIPDDPAFPPSISCSGSTSGGTLFGAYLNLLRGNNFIGTLNVPRTPGGRGERSLADRICDAVFEEDGEATATVELGASASINVPVIGGLVGNAGIVYDTAGNVGLIFEGGKAFGVGFGGQAGARLGYSSASSIQGLEGETIVSTTTLGHIAGGAVDVGVSPSSEVISGGVTVGLGTGFSASSAVTGTVVIPLFDLSEAVGCGD